MMRLGLLVCAVVLCTQIERIQGQVTCATGECAAAEQDEHLILDPYGDCYENNTFVDVSCDGTLGEFEDNQLLCLEGLWTDFPSCDARCTIPAIPNSNNEVVSEISDTARVTVECSAGYSFEQSTRFSVTCNDGTLTGTVPTQCFQDCEALPPPSNGSTSGGFLHGETMYYSCNRGYILNETMSETCNNGVWSEGQNTPTCYDLGLDDQIWLNCSSGYYVVAIPLALFDSRTAGVDSVLLGGVCKGTSEDTEYIYINSTYTDCETTIDTNSETEQVIYENVVRNADNGGNLITTDWAMVIDILCAFDQNNLVSSSAVMQNVLMQSRDGESEYALSFRVYSDAGYVNLVTGSDKVDANSAIFLKAQVRNVLELDVFPTDCYATPYVSSERNTSYQLITNGVSNDTEFANNLRDADIDGKPSFSFESKAFRFSNDESLSIYIHCWLKICPDYACPLPDNVGRRGRSIRNTQLTVTKHVFAGPIKIREPREAEDATGTTGNSWQMTAMMVYSATLSLIAVCVIGIMGVFVYRRRPITDGYGRI